MDINRLLNFLNYKLTSYTEHDLHSPFLYNFYMELIKNEYPFEDFSTLNTVRNKLLKNKSIISVTDFGAGSKKINSNTRSINRITKHGIAQKKQAEFLYRLVNKFSPKTIIELGTSIGLTSMYLAKASSLATLHTIEGCPNLFNFSNKQFNEYRLKNIKSINGNFNTELPKLLSTIDIIDLFYVDGNHTYESTLSYFKLALNKKNTNSIFIFDDINWSNGMKQAWKEIYTHKEVTLSLDLFYFGIVFFRAEQKNKEHFVLNF